jgi:hypothetical protein
MSVPAQDFFRVQRILCMFHGYNQGQRGHRDKEISGIAVSLWWGIIDL